MSADSRINRERKTIKVMVEMYCKAHHNMPENKLCAECSALLDYAVARIDKCHFIEDKPTCLKCPVHCYRQEQREQVRRIMRYSGPRMLFAHPVLAVLHLIDGARKFKTPKSRG